MAAQPAHAQLVALWLACVGWILTAVALGLIQWRVWQVSGSEDISSGVAWVGIWRTCFNSHFLVSPGFKVLHCQYISLTEAFTPPEIMAGQVLMILSIAVGLCGNAGGVYTLRNVFFGIEKPWSIRLPFLATGALCLLAAVMSLVPLTWNLNSVVTNQTIKFPPEFKMPEAPDSQHVGCGIHIGIAGAVLMFVSGIIFCTYRLPVRSQPRSQPPPTEEVHLDLPVQSVTTCKGNHNPSFESAEHL